MALVCSLILSGLFARSSRQRLVSAIAMAFSAYSLHLGMDLLTKGGRGLPVFWPFTNRLIEAPITLFPQVHHSEGFLYPGHIPVLIVEITYAIVLIGITLGIERWQRQRRPARNPPQTLMAPAAQSDLEASPPELTPRQ
jgi:membrane-bound metal-dependent hydrolase YbcI (DUF457 family)